jgi:hypothetical protein
MPVIGFLHPGWPDSYMQALGAFQKGLNEIGLLMVRIWRLSIVGQALSTRSSHHLPLISFAVR